MVLFMLRYRRSRTLKIIRVEVLLCLKWRSRGSKEWVMRASFSKVWTASTSSHDLTCLFLSWFDLMWFEWA